MRRSREAVEQAKQASFNGLAAGHLSMEQCLSVLLLSLLNPPQTAEEVASLDIKSTGPVVFGVGIGYQDIEYEAFGMTACARRCDGRLICSITAVRKTAFGAKASADP